MPSSSQYVWPSSLSLINDSTSTLELAPGAACFVLAFFEGEVEFASVWRFGAITLEDNRLYVLGDRALWPNK